MVKTISGKKQGKGKKIGIVVARFNEFITQRLLDGCLEELKRRGVLSKDITVVWVPGSYEIPVVALKLAKKRSIHAVICLGAIIRGETAHFDLVAQGCTYGVSQASLSSEKPVIFTVLATDTVDQASRRAQEKGDNRGRDAAEAAIEMISVLDQVKS